MGKRKQPDSSGGNLSYIDSSLKRFEGCYRSCILNFDGCCKGNPGRGGAGAVLRSDDGHFVLRLQEGVHVTTSNVAEYRALILGLKSALECYFTHIRVRGDSMVVCMQVQGKWKIKNKNLMRLCKEARELIDRFESFEIDHISREFNSEADALANKALHLAGGEVVKEFS